MKKNGFTLVELLAVIVVLSIIIGIVVTNVFNIYEDSKESAYNAQLDMIKESVKEYVLDNKRSLFASTNSTCVNISTLVLERYLEKIPTNPKTDESFSGDFGYLVQRNDSEITYQIVEDTYNSNLCNN